MSVASEVRFSDLVGLLERLARLNKTIEKQDMLKKFISQWREYDLKTRDNDPMKYSFFPAMRLLLPQMDRSRESYGIRESTLAKLYCDLLGLSEENVDAKKLINYKIPMFSKNNSGDFSEIVYGILKDRCLFKGSISIEEVNKTLDCIAEANGSLRKEIITEKLMYLLQNMTPLDQKWLIRMLLKEMRIGISAKTIFRCFHSSAEEFYNVTNDLEAVCMKFKEAGTEIPKSFDIKLFKPFKPMLSERGDPKNITVQLDGKDYIYEIKFDGERVQLHKDEDTYRYWSRNGLEWSNSYGTDPGCGTLTKYIHNQFKSTVKNCILDGEMMGYNLKLNKLGTKAENFDIKRSNVEQVSGYLPCFIVFDVLYLNDCSLTDVALLDRKRILDNEILQSELEEKIRVAKWKTGNTQEECVDAFNEAISNCDEGLMVKRMDSVYKVNSRKGGWFKMKPDYVLGLHEELDCVIIGGFYTGGREISEFLCAVKSGEKYLSFTKVGSGFTRKVLYEYNTKMSPYWKKYNKDNVPTWLELTGKAKDRPDLLIEPINSFIVQLKAAEIVKSSGYAAGYTLRFCRIDRFRDDKSPTEDCMTLLELETLNSQNQGKLALHPLEINSDEDDEIKGTDKVNLKRGLIKPQVASWLKPTTLSTKKMREADENESSIFQGKEFCILITGENSKNYSKKEFENFVVENGGVVVQNAGRKTYGVVPDKITVKVTNLIKSEIYDIIRPDWLAQCMTSKTFVKLTPSHYIFTKEKTKKYFETIFDSLGDSYTDEVTKDELRDLLRDMDNREIKIPYMSREEKLEFIDSNMLNEMNNFFLNGCCIYFHLPISSTSEELVEIAKIDRLGIQLQYCGAKVVRNVDRQSITHIVLTKYATQKDVQHFHEVNNMRPKRFYLVNCDWVEDCISNCSHLDERPFFINNLSKN